PSNVDDVTRLKALYEMLSGLSSSLPVVFPVHPRTQNKLAAFVQPSPGLLLTPPLGYLDFLHLMAESRLVLTDSGGIQEETTALQVPCLTIRENTERPITVDEGTNQLVGLAPDAVLDAARGVLRNGSRPSRLPALWDGQAARRILDILEVRLCPATALNGRHSS